LEVARALESGDVAGWPGYADAFKQLIRTASAADLNKLHVSALPWMTKCRWADGDAYRSIIAAIAARQTEMA
jgi:hypothetical protein